MSGSQQIILGGSPQAAAVDPYFYSVTSLLHGDGTNGAQNNTFLDSSTNNFTITRNGNTTQGSFSPFSQTGWGNYFDGSGDSLTFSSNAAFAPGTGDFTVEAWIFPTAAWGTWDGIFVVDVTGGIYFGKLDTGFGLRAYATANIVSTTAPDINKWTHVAVSRAGTTVRLFIDGALVASATSSQNFGQGIAYIGNSPSPGEDFPGYISNFRLVKGTAVYTANFTVPTTPLTAITNTSLLTCQANRFLDASSNAFAITRNGDVSVQPFSPFNPTTAYSTSAVGGSGYFDGSGDYLSVADNAAFDFGSGEFTVEAFFYPTSTGDRVIVSTWSSPDTNSAWEIIYFSGTLYCQVASSSTVTTLTTSSYPLNQWNHIAMVRTGNTLSAYLNGTRFATTAYSSTINNGNNGPSIGARAGGSSFPYLGYLSGVRIIKGAGPYDATSSSLTVPTAPLTAITNTQLLTNFTNAGIFDNAAVADYETVGNAQISTSVKKYGTGSMAFDGSGDRLFSPSNRQWNFGTGDFTIELWAYPTSQGGHGSSNNDCLIDFRPGTNGVYGTLYIFNSGTGVYWFVNSANRITGAAIPNNQWTHIAICRIASQTKLFINGTQSGATYADTNNYLVAPAMIGEFNDGVGGGNFQGYIDDLRISLFGRYPYNFTPPTAEFPNIGGTVTLTADPYFDYTTLLLPGNGTNGAQNNTFLDSSTNNFTITRNGNTTQGTFSPFSQTGWGNYFDGAAATRLTMPSNTAFAFGTGAYTVEGWVYLNAQAATQSSFFEAGTNTGALSTSILNNGAVSLGTYGVGAVFSSSANSVTPNQWFHVAVVRNSTASNDTKIYVNGTAVATGTDSSNWTVTTTPAIGGINLSGYTLNGYISNLRVVKGTAVYTANFTPPTTPLTAITNTSLLTCQSTRFIDNSTNAFAITRNGDVSVQAFSPFNPTAAWSASTNGGSGYFDGSGDYLTTTTSSAFDLSSGDWTIQGWYYPTAYSAGNNVVAYVGTSAGDKIVIATIGTGGGLYYLLNGSVVITGGSAPLNAWSFFALVKSGGTTTLYINGVSQGTTTSVPTSSNKSLNLGSDAGAAPYQGYIADFRILKGTANTAVPTAPLTAITNTSLLTNFTNAGIYDATSKNDLETVGNAQISTAQSKFGGSSMAFDGSGDWVQAPNNAIYNLGGGDFTIEFWLYVSSNPALAAGIATKASNSGNTGWSVIYFPGYVELRSGASTALIQSAASSISTTTWTHVAITRYGTSGKIFINGIQSGSTGTINNFTDSTTVLAIGALDTTTGWNANYPLNGYIDDLRITKGIARYTSNFTPPTTAFLTL
jgi:hypothetical protein